MEAGADVRGLTAHPLAPLALAFALGAAFPAQRGGWLAAGAGAVLALSPPLAPLGFACAGSLAAALARVDRGRPLAQGDAADGEVTLQGRVASVPERLDDRVRFLLRDRRGALVLATAPPLALPAALPLALGDAVRMQARLRAPEGERNPGGRDRAAELAARGVALEAHARTPPLRVAPPSPLAPLEAGRTRFAEAASRALPPRQAALVRAIGAGDRGGVDAATNDAFARSGLAHLLSVSGLHLAVVAYGAWRVLRAVLLRSGALAARLDPRRAAAALALPVTVGYALATGADVPVVRSALAAGLAFCGMLLDREASAADALALGALAVLAVDPGALLDASFQLSFASVAGLALLSGRLRAAIPLARGTTLLGRAREALLGAACASAAATIATAPIVACHFRRLSLLAVASNLAGVPIGSALTVVAALAAAACALAPGAAPVALLACRPLAAALLWVNDACAAPRWAAPGVGSPGLLGAALAYAGLLGACASRGRRRAACALAAAAALLLPPHLRHAAALRRGGLEVTFLSVGQGDAAAFLLPDGAAVVVDGGGDVQGRYDPGARDVVPWLRDVGVREVAAIVLSHPHPDHLGGLPAIAEAFGVRRLYTNGRPGDDAASAAFARLPPAMRLEAGASFERAGVRFEALGPPDGSDAWSENDASLVLRVSYGETAFLLAGDVEREGEAALVAGPSGGRLAADVVKVPHHGSATSSTAAFVAATHARFAVAPLGRDNRFGFPAPEVVARWRAAGAEVLRTDEGPARFLSDGHAVRRAPASAPLDALALLRERP